MKKNTWLFVFIGILLLVFVILGGRLFLARQNQAPTQPVKTTQQQQNNNSQQGGPDVPGQGAAGEGAGAGVGGNN